MDASTSPTTPLGPMTRARARALETEVTSLLSQLPFESHETWLLPGGDDAEHPTIIPMDASTSPTTPLGPMTRARARALETEVTSLLSQLPFESHETWLLPKSETLCMIRYKKDPPEDVHEDG